MTFETSGKFLDKVGGDLLVHIESAQKCLSSGQVQGKATVGTSAYTGSATVAGYPVLANNVPAVAGDEANVVGFIVFGNPWPALAADTPSAEVPPYTIIDVFDGAVLNENAIHTTDVDGGSFNLANIKGASALANVKWVADPVKTTEQKGGTPAT